MVYQKGLICILIFTGSIVNGSIASANTFILTEVGYIQDNSQSGSAKILNGATGVCISGSYAYVTAPVDNGLSIIDISAPTHPVEVGYIQDDRWGGSAKALQGAHDVCVLGNHAYVTATQDDALSIIDISNPTSPTEIGYIQDDYWGGSGKVLDGALNTYIVGNYAYVTATQDDGLSIINISDPTSPTEVGYIQDDSQGGSAEVLNFPDDVYVSGNYAYVTARNEDGLSIIDISNSKNPTEVGYIQDSEVGGSATVLERPADVYVSGKYAYVTSTKDHGLSVIDISDPTNPVEVGYIQDNSQGGSAKMLSGAGVPKISGNYAYVTAMEDDGLSVIDISDPTNPIEVGYIQDDSWGGSAKVLNLAHDVYISGSYAYVTATLDDGLSIIDISYFSPAKVKSKTWPYFY